MPVLPQLLLIAATLFTAAHALPTAGDALAACPCTDAYLAFWHLHHGGPPRLWLPETTLLCRTFCDNLAAVEAHNALHARGLTTYRVAVQPWHHLAGSVAVARKLGLLPPRGVPQAPRDRSRDRLPTADDLRPASREAAAAQQWDWYPQARVTDVRDQGMCGDCWAESAVAVLESRAAQAHDSNLMQLSVQQAAECTPQEKNMGCQGGWPQDVFQYVASNATGHRLCTEASYPTVIGDGMDRQCNLTQIAYNCTNVTVPFDHIFSVPQDNDTALFQALQGDVVSVAIDAGGMGFSSYAEGVYDGTFNGQPDCSTTQLDHAVVAIGWGVYQERTPYYLVRNSWGVTGWGAMGGNILFLRGNNTCGIAHDAVFLR